MHLNETATSGRTQKNCQSIGHCYNIFVYVKHSIFYELVQIVKCAQTQQYHELHIYKARKSVCCLLASLVIIKVRAMKHASLKKLSCWMMQKCLQLSRRHASCLHNQSHICLWYKFQLILQQQRHPMSCSFEQNATRVIPLPTKPLFAKEYSSNGFIIYKLLFMSREYALS